MTSSLLKMKVKCSFNTQSIVVGMFETIIDNFIPVMLKDGELKSFYVQQNTVGYTLKVTTCQKGLWVSIEESVSNWKLIITNELLEQTAAKSTGATNFINFKDFVSALLSALSKTSDKWSVGIMTPAELEALRGGKKTPGGQKLYMILSNREQKAHYPFTLLKTEVCQKEKLLEGINAMKKELEELQIARTEKSNSSYSILSETGLVSQQLKVENEELKKQIRICEESLTQKRGAVEIDTILKQKNGLEIKAETKKRQDQKEIVRLRNLYQLTERSIAQMKQEVDLVTRELEMLEQNLTNPAKLRSHAMRVLKSLDTELRNGRKVLMKQTRQIETVRRNINNAKNTERKLLTKIKQVQAEIDQAKKKANIQEISNRLHAPGSYKASSIASSSKAPSLLSNASSNGRAKSYGQQPSNRNYVRSNNLVRTNLLKKTTEIGAERKNKEPLLRTQPHISPNVPRKSDDYKPPPRPVVSSHKAPKQANNNERVRNYQNRMTYQGGTTKSNRSQQMSVKSASPSIQKKKVTQEDRERQKRAMERLAGVNSRQKKETAPKNIQKTQTRSLHKPALNSAEKKGPKEILQKMKEVKAMYNNKVQSNAIKNKKIATRIEQLTRNT